MNAHSAIEMFEKDLLADDQYYVLKCGFYSVITKLEQLIKEHSNVTILLNQKVTDIQDKKVKVDKEKYRALKIISTMPYYGLREIDLFKNQEWLESVTPIPLLRIYTRYGPVKNGKVWFQGLKKQ